MFPPVSSVPRLVRYHALKGWHVGYVGKHLEGNGRGLFQGHYSDGGSTNNVSQNITGLVYELSVCVPPIKYEWYVC